MYKYRVHYQADDDTKDTVEERSSEGLMTVETDIEVTEQEHIIEILRQIGKDNGFTSVKLVNMFQELEILDER